MQDHAGAAAARSADKHQRSEVLRAAHISKIKAKALDETRKVEEVTFINTLNNEGRKADLQQRLEEGKIGEQAGKPAQTYFVSLPVYHDCATGQAQQYACDLLCVFLICCCLLHLLCDFTGEARRAEALAAILAKQQGAATCVKEAAERRRQAEAERLAQLAERQRRKQEAQVGTHASLQHPLADAGAGL